VAHLEAGQKLGSENVTAFTMTLVRGGGNRMIVPSEKKKKNDSETDLKEKISEHYSASSRKAGSEYMNRKRRLG